METKQSISMNSGQRIDVHCHLFNKKIASVSLLLNLIKSISQRKKCVTKTDEQLDTLPSLSQIRRMSQLLKILFSDNDDTLLKHLIKYEPDTIFAPLMFDLTFAVESKEALEAIRQMRDELQQELEVVSAENTTGLRSEEPDGFTVLLNTIDDFLAEKEDSSANGLRSSQQTDTFDVQYTQLLAIRNRYPSIIKPFFAVDPRRKEVYRQMKHAIESDGFTGVKLYCPNGYSPLDPRLDEVYQYCLEHQLPVTAHCSYGGFATLENKIDVRGAIYEGNRVKEYTGPVHFKKRIIQSGGVEERALLLNHPDLWKVVLERYKGLRLNLAHMGVRGSENIHEKHEWSDLIIQMMLEHENLYTDLSCMSEKESIAHLWDLGSKADKQCLFNLKVTDRIMFGTDFWLNVLFKDLALYLNDFESVFTHKQKDLIRLQQINPKRFLNLR